MPSKQVEDVYNADPKGWGNPKPPRQKAKMQDDIKTLTSLCGHLCDKLHELKVTFNFTRLVMDDTARKEAGQIVRDIEGEIDVARATLATLRAN